MNDLILQYDRDLFLFLNGLHNSTFDFIMHWISDSKIWIPFYAILLFALYKKYGFKGTVFAAAVVIAVIVITDQASVKLFKNVFMRYRPCHNLEIKDMVHIVYDHCGGKYGFVSSHAANTFGLATIIGLLLRNRIQFFLLLTWAALVSYSRIYLGVHYPGGYIGWCSFRYVCGLCAVLFQL